MLHYLGPLLLLLGAAFAQVLPFTIDGILEAASADTTAFNSGGSVNIDGEKITIPKNLFVQFPAAWIPFKQVAGGSFTGREASITGNVVNGVPIAALFKISGLFGEVNNGVITSLEPNGAIHLDNGQTLRINDPNSVYSAGYSLSPEFTADDQNPSITAFSGFPMCVPRSASDPKCPVSNRPDVTGPQTFTAPDPTVMAPFKAGDYLTYSGIRVGGETICYSITAESVQILTADGAPAYIRMEDAIIGVVDGQPAANAEFADTRFIGYTTNGGVSVTISRMDVDPCTGNVSYTAIGAAVSNAKGARNKFIFRASSTTQVPYSREYRITGSTGTLSTNGGQITAGQFVQPVTDWILPEPAVMGVVPPKNDFTNFKHLVNGLGPDPVNPTNIWGPLDPFPDVPSPSPSPIACTAGSAPASVPSQPASRDTVTITSYTWTNQNAGTLSVTASTTDTKATLSLIVNDGTANPASRAMTSTGGGKWTFQSRGIKKPSGGVTVNSTSRGSATQLTTTA